MSDTPETEAVAVIEGNWDTKALRMGNFARKLERERNAAYDALRNIREGYGGQKVDEECMCDDCNFLRPIDAILKKVKIHKFWIPSENSTGTSKYKNFVSKADYNSLLKQFNELKNSEYDRGKEDGYSLAHDEIRYIR